MQHTIYLKHNHQFISVQLLSPVRFFATPWFAAHQATLSITKSGSSLKPTSIELVMPSSHFILCRLLFLLPPVPPSIRLFSNKSTLRMRWSNYWSFRFSINPSKKHPGPISFRMDWLDPLAVQGTLKSLLQQHCYKASVFFFYFIFKLYNIVLVLPNIEMNPPEVYLCSPSWTLLPPPSPFCAQLSSQSNSHIHSWPQEKP